MNQAEFEKHIDSYSKIHDEAEKVAEEYVKVFGHGREYIDHFEVDYDGFFGTIEITTLESFCSCCPSEYSSYSIPLSSIYDSKWIKKEKDKRAAEQVKKAERKAAAKVKQDEKDKEARYQKFLDMKKEYENE